MKCPKCGFISFDTLDSCKKCGRDLTEAKIKLNIPSFTQDVASKDETASTKQQKIIDSPDSQVQKAPQGVEKKDIELVAETETPAEEIEKEPFHFESEGTEDIPEFVLEEEPSQKKQKYVEVDIPETNLGNNISIELEDEKPEKEATPPPSKQKSYKADPKLLDQINKLSDELEDEKPEKVKKPKKEERPPSSKQKSYKADPKLLDQINELNDELEAISLETDGLDIIELDDEEPLKEDKSTEKQSKGKGKD